MNTPILVVAPHFPHLGRARDGQGRYVLDATLALHETGADVRVLALRFGQDPSVEEFGGIQITRIEPSAPLKSVFALYEGNHLLECSDLLAHAAASLVASTGATTWCHGYECGSVARVLSENGTPVTAVVHYLVAQESVYDLALGDDPIRREAFDSPLATAVGRAVRPSFRPAAVAMASKGAGVMRHLPAPRAIRDQFEKLHLERELLTHAHRVVGVGKRFARSIQRHYPLVSPKLHACHAGAPSKPLPSPEWPWPIKKSSLRVVCVGRPTGQKGWDYLLAALKLLIERQPILAERVELVAVGGLGVWNGPYSRFSSHLAAELQRLGSIRFHNASELDHDQVRALFKGADLLVHPAVFEPFGLVLLEAMQARCCVLSTNVDGPSEILAPPWGRVVDFRSPQMRAESLLAGLTRVLGWDRAVLEHNGLLAQQASLPFTWGRCAKTHLLALKQAQAVVAQRTGRYSSAPVPGHKPIPHQQPPNSPLETGPRPH